MANTSHRLSLHEVLLKQLYQLSSEQESLDAEIKRLQNQRIPLIYNVKTGQKTLSSTSKEYMEIKANLYSPTLQDPIEKYSDIQQKYSLQRRFNQDQDLILERQANYVQKQPTYRLFKDKNPPKKKSKTMRILEKIDPEEFKEVSAGVELLEDKIKKIENSIEETNAKIEDEQKRKDQLLDDIKHIDDNLEQIPELAKTIQNLKEEIAQIPKLVSEQNNLKSKLHNLINSFEEPEVNSPEDNKTPQQVQIDELEREIAKYKRGIEKCDQNKLMLIDIMARVAFNK